MGAEEMAHANWRLDNPPVVDVAVSRRMGLFVVARLAARHGIRVRLRPAAAGGLTALVWLPDEVISHDADKGGPGGRRFDTSAAGSAMMAVPATLEDMVSPLEQEIAGSRPPQYASLEPDGQPGNGKLGVRRVPGAGPMPGDPLRAGAAAAATTGPLPAFRSIPQQAEPGDADRSAEDDLAPVPAAEQSHSGPQSTSPLPAVDLTPPTVQLGQPAVSGTAPGRPEPAAFGRDSSSNGDVIIPQVEHVAAENRLPIFEAVESDWFRRGRSAMGGWPGPDGPATAATLDSPPAPEAAWATPSDRGWEVAAAVSSPATGGTTSAGLPKRVPQANLVPGAATQESAAPGPARSAAATRDRFSNFQRGSREGRAAALGDENGSDREDGSR
jgi:hypothetical protein